MVLPNKIHLIDRSSKPSKPRLFIGFYLVLLKWYYKSVLVHRKLFSFNWRVKPTFKAREDGSLGIRSRTMGIS